ncbi:MAG: transcriptional regulator [Thermoproteales archaeon]|nr:transcriptional regulator [Thermoproteales archaeon]
MDEDLLTLREKLTKLLMKSDKPLTVEEMAIFLGLNVNEYKRIYNELYHIAKTIRRKTNNRLMLYMAPPVCESCGYVFKKLEKPKKPSKCPKCKSERISSPKFFIREN